MRYLVLSLIVLVAMSGCSWSTRLALEAPVSDSAAYYRGHPPTVKFEINF